MEAITPEAVFGAVEKKLRGIGWTPNYLPKSLSPL
jgi:hypothetical protein